MIGCFFRKCRIAIGLIALVASGSLANAQEITVVPLSQSAAASTYAVSPHLDGVTFVGDEQDENCFLIVVDGDVNNAHQLTVRPEGALMIPSQTGLFALASPIIQLRDGHYAVSFVAIPVEYQGTNSETSAKQQWMADNSAWSVGQFGFGWQESFGEWLAANVLIPVVGQENLANASNTTLVTGTVVVAVPTAIAIVAGGEVVLGVGTVGGVATGGCDSPGLADTGGEP